MEKISGKITGIVFSNKNNGFHVLKVKTDQTVLRVCGNFPNQNISVGLKANFAGRTEQHPTYGPQFTASGCEIIPESGRSGVITYITSNINSVGIVTASRLYDYFGENLVKILDEDPNQIRTCSFLTKKQSDAIIEEWQNANESRNSSIYLSDLGLNGNQIKSVFTLYGVKTREIVNSNPYLLSKASGVSFITADQAARRLGVGVDDPKRVRAIILHIIEELSNGDGHMYVTTSQIFSYSSKRLFKRQSIEPFTHGDFLTESQYYPALQNLLDSKELVSVDDKIYTETNWNHESTIAKSVAKSIVMDPYIFENLDKELDDYEKKNHIVFSEDQRKAFNLLTKSRLIAISGFPGTGKTTLISAFVRLFEIYNLDFHLLSPTGIAAKRLTQITKKVASTIHRALGYKKDGTWEFNPSNKFITDAVIVDEMSMVDSATLFHLLSALDSKTIIIMVGDSAQLPSVGAGYVFNNLLNCKDVPNVSLTKIFRQGETSDIISVAHGILRNEAIDTSLNKNSEFVFLNMKETDIIKEVCLLTTKLKELGRNFQVVSPMHEGELGVNNLNQELRDILNPGCFAKDTSYIKNSDSGLYEGDRVMVVKNDYDKMVFNGDVGKIQRINIKKNEVEIKVFGWFDQDSPTPKYIDKIITFTLEEARSMLKVAYACTAHKCQGAEFDYIIMPMTHQFGNMLYRNLVYTAITRAKKKVFIFGNPTAFMSAISNDRQTVRNSCLNTLISDSVKLELTTTVMSA
jgi:exodeoxyribonuclease V alpha subunit